MNGIMLLFLKVLVLIIEMSIMMSLTPLYALFIFISKLSYYIHKICKSLGKLCLRGMAGVSNMINYIFETME